MLQNQDSATYLLAVLFTCEDTLTNFVTVSETTDHEKRNKYSIKIEQHIREILKQFLSKQNIPSEDYDKRIYGEIAVIR